MRDIRELLLVLFTSCLALGSVPSSFDGDRYCRCQPGEACWPSLADWQALNMSIQGTLVEVRPIGHVCHEPTYNKADCERVSKLSSNGTWRASQPGAQQEHAWEVSLSRNESCYVGPANPAEPCGQGRIPRYSAMVETTEQAQKAIRFARERRLRLVIKNTGHDSGGRSSAVDSFQILTQRLKDISFIEEFTPTLAETRGPSVRIGAGVLTKELYAVADEHGYTAMGGECATVGVAGGYIQGGGVSTALTPMMGLAADLVQEFEVISAEGSLVIANEFQNQDLFWALRGGGGGTVGLVTSITMPVFGAIPANISELSFESQQPDEAFWTAVKEMIYVTRDITTGGNSGQYWVGRGPTGSYFVRQTLFFLGETDIEPADKMGSLLRVLQDQEIAFRFNVTAYPRLSSFLAIPQGEFVGGIAFHQENILIPQGFYDSPEGPAQLVDRLAEVKLNPGDMWVANTLGGQVMANKDVDNAMHSGWRTASVLLVGNRIFEPALKSQLDVQERLTAVEGPLLHSIGQPAPEAIYLNEADADLENWQDWFWGEKYARLRDIKSKWDPDDLFLVRHGVGSEDWDEDGMCRMQLSPQECPVREHSRCTCKFFECAMLHVPGLL
uniref:FAD-linked oxidoreductase notD' n=1 Tax=Aspergillus versicolor TaxID=46472 RepID=NOTD_ASPVE|nr:RecName: Full=FAD-linked oxidoreductase notD'; AltName: Full=Notoamide biosynthesis cluster protein D'; Flags: Precursor [Aspergillus versicolor]AGC83575.1 oxidoreductase [Aspergillus versicolor]